MKKINIILVFLLFINILFFPLHTSAMSKKDNMPIDKVIDTRTEDDVTYVSIIDASTQMPKLFVYEIGVEKYIFNSDFLGNIYMYCPSSGINKVVAKAVEIQQATDVDPADAKIVTKAGKEWVLTRSGKMVAFRITDADLLDLGLSAIQGAIEEFIQRQYPGSAIVGSLKGIAQSILQGAIEGETYETNVTMNSYYYSGCMWLGATEFVFPGGKTAFSYRWSDNPQLGIAPYACKLASTKYPYMT